MHFRRLVLAAVVVMGSAGYAIADQPGSGWITREQVMQTLSAAGYTNVTELEADDGHWEGKGTKNGTIMEFHVDPLSGALTKEEVDE